MNLQYFNQRNLFEASLQFFQNDLNIPLNVSGNHLPFIPKKVLKNRFKENKNHYENINDIFHIGFVSELAFQNDKNKVDFENLEDKYKEGILVFAIDFKHNFVPNRTEIAETTRDFNVLFNQFPCIVLFHYQNFISIATNIRENFKSNKDREKVGKVVIIKDIDTKNTHRGHINILQDLQAIEDRESLFPKKITNYEKLYQKWLDVFSLKILGNQFYLEIAKWYHFALKEQNIQFNSEVNRQDFTLKIITRTIFIWFLKEKNLIDQRLFDKNILQQNILNDFDKEKSTYYKAILQTLFFEVLNKKIENRFQFSFAQEQNYQIWCKDFTKVQEAFNIKTPFINGGLFDADKAELPLDNPNICKINIPNFLFFDKNKNIDLSKEFGNQKKFQNTEVDGLIDILQKYKFTIEENTPLETVVALDPEFLGKIFESLLAVRNEETGDIARKSTGSFYTPREIVDYMVEESLLAYLKNENCNIENFENLQDISDKEKQNIIRAFEKLKILDPACGSGAYPMGILQKMQIILKEIDPENKAWFESLIKSFPNYLQNEMREKFKNENLDYLRKLGIILNSIYGVDIQPIAVQISKLRCFLSLIIDQKTNQDKESNFGVKALPNLEFKFVAANTLISLGLKDFLESNDAKMFTNKFEIQVQEMQTLVENYFQPETAEIKKEIQTKIKQKQKEIFQEIGNVAKSNKTAFEIAQKITQWQPFDDTSFATFFDALYMFGIKDGFDIVIGNPPYIGEKGNKKTFEPVKNSFLGERFYLGKMDFFCFFFHLALDVAKEKGIICLITTNYYITATGAKKLRDDFKERSTILNLINFNELKIFESAAGQHNMITILQKGKYPNNAKTLITNVKGYLGTDILTDIILGKNKDTKYYQISQDKLFSDGNMVLTSGGIDDILDKMTKNSKLLGDICNINQGLLSGADTLTDEHIKKFGGIGVKNEGVFVLDLKNDKDLILFQSIPEEEKNILKPFYKNSDIEKYIGVRNNTKFVIYVTKKINILNYPTILNHLTKFKDLLKARLESYNESYPWYCLHREREQAIFENEKIIVPYRNKTNIFGYSKQNCYFRTDFYCIISKNKNISHKFLLAFLNSKLTYIWLYYRGKRKGEVLELFFEPLSKIPIPDISLAEQKPFELLVDYILWLKSNEDKAVNEYVPNSHVALTFEGIIDAMVFELYFEESVKKENADVLQYINKENGFEALSEEMSEEQKRKLIGRVYDTFSEKEHKVRNHIILQKYVSEIQTILVSFKK